MNGRRNEMILGLAVMLAGPQQLSAATEGGVEEQVRQVAPPAQDGDSGHGVYEPARSACLTPPQRRAIQRRIRINQAALGSLGLLPAVSGSHAPIQPVSTTRLEWPVVAVGSAAQDYGFHGISRIVDQDPAVGALLDFACGSRTYDGHRGVDIFSWPFAWNLMAGDEVQIVAAAPGTIVWKQDGNFDQSCSASGGMWNAVYVQHADGSVAWYGHLKKDSLTTKSIGEAVAVGEYLGVMGSSGNSTGPHLHLEVYDASGNLADPFAGPCDGLSPWPVWEDQPPYYDSAVNRVQVGDAPVAFAPCPGLATPNEVSVLPKGTLGYFTTFYRDQLAGQVSNYRILRPNGSVFQSWSHSITAPHSPASWWWWSWTIPANAPSGVWRFEVDFEGSTYVAAFSVN